MSTTDDTANDSTAGQSTRRRVHIVPPHPLGPRVLRRCFEQVERGRSLVSGYACERTFATASGSIWRR
jgi:hypothetical protein